MSFVKGIHAVREVRGVLRVSGDAPRDGLVLLRLLNHGFVEREQRGEDLVEAPV